MKIRILFIALLFCSFSWGQIIYQDNFGTGSITTKPYTGTPTSADSNLNTFSWTTSAAAFSGAFGNGGSPSMSLSLGASGGTPTYTFTFNVASGYELSVTQFDFWRVRSTTGAQNWSMTINGTNVGSGTIPTTGASLGATNVSTPISSLTGTITIVLTYSGASGTGTFRLDDFTLYGTVTSTAACTTPTSQASAISSSNVTTTTADLSWTNGVTAAGTLVSLRQTSNAITAPSSGTNYTANTAFGSAGLIDANNRVVYKNTGTSVTGISGLTAGTQYTATPYAYNGSGTNVCFNTTNPESFDFWTLATEPTGTGSFSSCNAASTSSITLGFTAASTIPASGYLLIYRQGAAPTGLPVDGTVYTAGSTIGDATVVNYYATGPQTVTGLNGGSTYYFALIPYNATAGPVFATINYRTSTYASTNCNTSPAPEINVKGVVGSNPSITDGDTTPSALDNTLFGTAVVGSPISKNFRIENIGNATLSVTGITMTGANPGDFVVSGITFTNNIAGGTSVDFTVTFTPGAAGTRTAIINIANNDSNEANYDFVLQGTGTATALVEINVKGNGQSIPDNSIYPSGTNWTYFPVTLQGSSSTRIFTIENLGTTNLALTGASPYIQITGAHASQFSVSIIPSNSIAGGSSTTFEITFSPTSGGSKNATLIIANNDSDENPYNFNISGTCQGSSNIYVSGNGYDIIKTSTTTSTTNLTNFGLIPVLGTKQNTFVITNLSGGTRYLSNVAVSGADASMFTVVSQPNNGAFANGNTTSFTVNFTPASAGVKNAVVTFNVYTNSGRTTLDTLDGTFYFSISGEGIIYTPCSNNSVQTIAIQDFEAAPATPTWTYNSTTDGTVNIAGGTFNNGSGAVNGFLGARSYQFKGIGTTTTRTAVITLAPQDVSQYNNINFSMRVGAFRVSGTTQGLDLNELVQVETSTDGVNWSVESVLRGYTNSRWSFATTGVFNAYYTGNNSGVTMDTRLGNAELTGAAGISYYYVRNLPQSATLQIRITLNVDRDDELWALDDIKLEGQTAQSTTWNGSSWTAGFPTPSTKAIFDTSTSYTTTAAANHGSVEACELQVKSGANVIVDSGYYFEIQSDVKNAGTLTIANNGSLVQINDAASNIGDIIYQRTAAGIRGSDYVYWSSPVSGQSVGSIYSTPSTPGYTYKWNPTATNINSPISSGNWQVAGGTMSIGEGYIVRGSGNFYMPASSIPASFTGAPNNGVIPVTISRANNTATSTPGPGNGISISNFDDNWNLVGNPYPSSINAINFLSNNTDLQGFVYLWTHGTSPATIANPFYGSYLYNYTSSDYITYNSVGASTGPSTFNGYIAGAQGFFVLMNDGSSLSSTINFKNSMRNKTYANSQFYKTSNGDDERHRIWLDLVDANNQSVRTLVGYLPEATTGLDRLCDAFKNTANSFEIYSLASGQTLTIQGRPTPFDSNDVVPIGVRIMQDGAHKIAIAAVDGLFSDSNQSIYLEDKLLNIVYDLRQNPYSFNANAGTINDRFLLRYNNTTLGNPDFGDADGNVILTSNNGQLGIKSAVEMIQEVSVFDLLGRQLFNAKAIESRDFATSNIVRQQALIVKIKLENGTIVTRKIVL